MVFNVCHFNSCMWCSSDNQNHLVFPSCLPFVYIKISPFVYLKAGEPWRSSVRNAQRTSEFLWTSADCSSFRFPAAWRNPPGTDVAAYYRPLSTRKGTVTKVAFQLPFVVCSFGPQSLYLYMNYVGNLTECMHEKCTALYQHGWSKWPCYERGTRRHVFLGGR